MVQLKYHIVIKETNMNNRARMKIRSILIAFLIVCVCSCAAYAAYTSDPKEKTLRKEKIFLPVIPDYLLSALGDGEKGFFASLFGRIKTFFAGLFA